MPVQIRERYQYFTQASLVRLRQAGYSRPFTPLEPAISDYVSSYLTRPDPYR
jgi:ADP-L-glycero-D-manno-heptose 6-epimerase